MMKWKWLPWLGLGLVAGAVGLAVFYHWAKAATRSPSTYAEIATYGESASPSAAPQEFTVVTYNIGYLSGLTNNLPVERSLELFTTNAQTAIAALDALEPDIIGLQEVDLDAQRSYRVDQVKQVAEGVSLATGAIAVNWDKRYVPFPFLPPTAHFGRIVSGQAILSRYPIIAHERIVLSPVMGQPFFYRALYLDRVAQVTTIDIAGRPLIVINVHLEAFDEPTRARQTQEVLDLVNMYADTYPVLLMGDFNSTMVGRDEAERTIKQVLAAPNLTSALDPAQVGALQQFTYPSDQPDVQLDYIFYTPETITAIAAEVVPSAAQASDHLPIALRFRFRDGESEPANADQIPRL